MFFGISDSAYLIIFYYYSMRMITETNMECPTFDFFDHLLFEIIEELIFKHFFYLIYAIQNLLNYDIHYTKIL